jgi:hypothetical protein
LRYITHAMRNGTPRPYLHRIKSNQNPHHMKSKSNQMRFLKHDTPPGARPRDAMQRNAMKRNEMKCAMPSDAMQQNAEYATQVKPATSCLAQSVHIAITYPLVCTRCAAIAVPLQPRTLRGIQQRRGQARPAQYCPSNTSCRGPHPECTCKTRRHTTKFETMNTTDMNTTE